MADMPAMPPRYTASRVISLKAHPEYDEKWLQAQIVSSPELLGLGALDVKDVERRQPGAGRLDLLLQDASAPIRYTVEIQLGRTDPDHIMRTLEYWDLERKRYPQYDHVAVIVAEEITGRFLNVISLFNGAIPIVAVQIRALEVADHVTLTAVKVLDVFQPGSEGEEGASEATDRAYWESKATKATMSLLDEAIKLVDAQCPGLTPKYTKHYIGLSQDGGVANNFMVLRPQKKVLLWEFRVPRSDELSARLEDRGIDQLDYDSRWRNYRLRLSPGDLEAHRQTLEEMIALAYENNLG